jgi:hypothetical protein
LASTGSPFRDSNGFVLELSQMNPGTQAEVPSSRRPDDFRERALQNSKICS